MKEQAGFVSGKVFSNDIFSIKSLPLEEVKGLSWSFLIKELISFTRLPSLLLNHFSKVPPSNTTNLVNDTDNLDCQLHRTKHLGSQCSILQGVYDGFSKDPEEGSGLMNGLIPQ